MKELGDILRMLRGSTEQAVLVTVVAVEGSTYRRPGARMLVRSASAGGRIGSISGGCLEDEVRRRAWYLTETGPSVVTYETGLDDGPSPGYSLGCGGRVTVLFERVDPRAMPAYLNLIEQCREAGCAAAVATVISSQSRAGPRVGDRIVLATEERTVLADAGLDGINADVFAALATSCSRVVAYDLPEGRIEVAIEVVASPIHLHVFGIGHDAEPLVSLAAGLGWRVSVVGKKITQEVRSRLSVADELVHLPGAGFPGVAAGQARRAAAIVMNHNYALDLEALRAVLFSGFPYIGVLGPRHRTDSLLADSAEQGIVPTAAQLTRIHAPVGLDIGAETPAEVALAIIAEVQAFFADRPGGPLRDRVGAIHGDSAESVITGAASIDAACFLGDGS